MTPRGFIPLEIDCGLIDDDIRRGLPIGLLAQSEHLNCRTGLRHVAGDRGLFMQKITRHGSAFSRSNRMRMRPLCMEKRYA